MNLSINHRSEKSTVPSSYFVPQPLQNLAVNLFFLPHSQQNLMELSVFSVDYLDILDFFYPDSSKKYLYLMSFRWLAAVSNYRSTYI